MATTVFSRPAFAQSGRRVVTRFRPSLYGTPEVKSFSISESTKTTQKKAGRSAHGNPSPRRSHSQTKTTAAHVVFIPRRHKRRGQLGGSVEGRPARIGRRGPVCDQCREADQSPLRCMMCASATWDRRIILAKGLCLRALKVTVNYLRNTFWQDGHYLDAHKPQRIRETSIKRIARSLCPRE